MIVDMILLAIFVAIMAAVIWLAVQDDKARNNDPPGKKKPTPENPLPTGSDDSSRLKPI